MLSHTCQFLLKYAQNKHFNEEVVSVLRLSERNSLERKMLEGRLRTEKCNTCIVSSKRYLYVLRLLK
jgi:hypothetical protein